MRVRVNYNGSKPKKSLSLNNFKGVDFSTSPLDVSRFRAVNSKNLINELGTNRKRKGWKTILSYKGEANLLGAFQVELNGEDLLIVIKDIDSDSDLKFDLYKIEDEVFIPETIEYDTHLITKEEKIIDNCQCYVLDEIAYIIGLGKFLMLKKVEGVYKLIKVSDSEDVYIPTVLSGIKPHSEDEIGEIYSLERYNMLTRKIKVDLDLDPVFFEEEQRPGGTFYLRHIIDANYPVTMTFTSRDNILKTKTITLDPKIDALKVTGLGSGNKFMFFDGSFQIDILGEQESKFEYMLSLAENSFKLTNTENYSIGQDEVREHWKITLEFTILGNEEEVAQKNGSDGLISLFQDVEFTLLPDEELDYRVIDASEPIVYPILDGFMNEEQRANTINKCTISTLFGVGGNSDRLFLSGNEDSKNVVYYSQFRDFTYFPDTYTQTLGDQNNPVISFNRIADGTLCALKEDNNQDFTIFYLNELEMPTREYAFSAKPGALGEGAISRYTSANLSGDNLFLSENGVFGIVGVQNFRTNERYARERSRFINGRLTRHKDLSKAKGIVFKNRYYLAIDNVVYVADARLKTSPVVGDMLDTFNYEWYYWTDVPVKFWTIINDRLCFGADNGTLCEFNDNSDFIDETYIDLKTGSESNGLATLDPIENVFQFGEPLKKLQDIKDGDKVKTLIHFADGVPDNEVYELNVKYGSLYNVLVSNNEVETIDEYGYIILKNKEHINDIVKDTVVYIRDKEIVYGEYVNDNPIEPIEARIVDVDYNEGSFRLKLEDDSIFNDVFVDIIENISTDNGVLHITDVDLEEFTFKLKRSKDAVRTIRFTQFNDSVLAASSVNENIIWRLTNLKPVDALWETPILNLGTNVYSKTLTSIITTTEPYAIGKVSVGYETRKNIDGFDARMRGEGIDFNEYIFDTEFATSYTKRVREKNFNFIKLRFYNNENADMAINDITITYKVNKENKGVN